MWIRKARRYVANLTAEGWERFEAGDEILPQHVASVTDRLLMEDVDPCLLDDAEYLPSARPSEYFASANFGDLGDFITRSLGDGSLTQWEEQFLLDMKGRYQQFGSSLVLSEAQCRKLNQIADKLWIPTDGTSPPVVRPEPRAPKPKVKTRKARKPRDGG